MLKKIITIIGVVSITITSIFYMSCNVTKNIVSYKEYKKGNSTNQILDKILSDNTLQVEKENMFNYASNGMYISGVGTSGPEYATDESQKTTGLYSMEDDIVWKMKME